MPVPTEAAPAVRSARIAGWRTRAPKARSERVMHLGRSGAPSGFLRFEMASTRYRYVAWPTANARMTW